MGRGGVVWGGGGCLSPVRKAIELQVRGMGGVAVVGLHQGGIAAEGLLTEPLLPRHAAAIPGPQESPVQGGLPNCRRGDTRELSSR